MNASPRLPSMLRRSPSALARRRGLLPTLLLALALGLTLALNSTHAHFYAYPEWQTSINMAIAENLSPQHGFRMFTHLSFVDDGEPLYVPYSRFPIGGFALIKLAISPFGDHLAVKLFAARMLMLALFAAAAFLAFRSIARIASNQWIALTATLIAFSSYYVLRHSNHVSTEFMVDLFAVMLAFHGMVVFIQEGRFNQLLIKTCIALMLGWHVYAFLAPFITLGLGSELISALKMQREFRARLQSLFSTALRSPYLMLGAVAILFGVAILSFNFISEYTAYDGEVAFVDLPSVQSMLGRTGFEAGIQDGFPWGDFLRGQFYRIAGSTLPPALTNWPGVVLETPPNSPPSHFVAVGILAAGASTLGLLFGRGRRILLGTLSLSGLCWATALRYNTAYYNHQFEAIYYVGIPLTLVTLLLLAARGNRFRRLFPAAALAAALLFALSALHVIPKEPEDARLTERQQAILADFAEIRKFTQGKNALVAQTIDEREALYPNRTATLLYLAGSRIRHTQPFRTGGPASFYPLNNRESFGTPRIEDASGHDFVVASSKVEQFFTLTPGNSIVFLYGQVDPNELKHARLDTIVSGASGDPAAQSRYDVYIDGRALIYRKEPCDLHDIAPAFFLHILPARVEDLPEWRKADQYDNLDFSFHLHGVALDGECAAKVPLPAYAIKGIRTGQWTDADGEIWDAAFPFDPAAIQSAYEAARSREPDARAAFDLYLDKESRVLIYARESCDSSDIDGPFFLHVTPRRVDDLPDQRREYRFDNLDFDFRLHGAAFDGKCAAAVYLPQYEILSLRTGQWTRAAGEIWRATLRFSS